MLVTFRILPVLENDDQRIVFSQQADRTIVLAIRREPDDALLEFLFAIARSHRAKGFLKIKRQHAIGVMTQGWNYEAGCFSATGRR